jgi:hypothetical protein
MRFRLAHLIAALAILAVLLCIAIRSIGVLPLLLMHRRWEQRYRALYVLEHRHLKLANPNGSVGNDSLLETARCLERHNNMKRRYLRSLVFFWSPIPREAADPDPPPPPVPRAARR